MTSVPEMRPFAESLPMALLQAREVAMRYFRPLLAEHDLTEQQWRVLRALTSADDALDAGELAARTLLLAPSLSRILAHLDERGFVTRTIDPTDQRRTLVELSPLGAKQVAQIAPESERLYAEIEAVFGDGELHALLESLHQFARKADPDPS